MSRPPSMVQALPPDLELRRRVESVDGIERGIGTLLVFWEGDPEERPYNPSSSSLQRVSSRGRTDYSRVVWCGHPALHVSLFSLLNPPAP